MSLCQAIACSIMDAMIGSRLAEARKRKGLAQVDLAVAMGERYDQSVVSAVENNRSSLRFDGLLNAARELEVSIDYLFGLTDDPTPTTRRTDTNHAIAETEGSREFDSEETIGRLDEVAAAAGSGAEVYDETVTARVPFRSVWLHEEGINPAYCHIIGVRGDSMEPTLPDGCQIIVDRSRRELGAGRIYVMRTEEGLVVKRAKQNAQGWWLMSDNPEWPPLFLTEETDIIGEVRWAARIF